MAKILVVEDNAIQSRLMDQYLRSRGYDVITAANGQDALEQLDRSAPDLIVLDLALPGMSGIELLTRIRSILVGRDVPVIITTASTDSALIRQAAELGAVYHFVKSQFALSELLRAVEEYVHGGPHSKPAAVS